jgi:hypothetical protein
VQRQLVQQRTTLINLLRALLREEGLRLASGGGEPVTTRLDRLAVPARLQTTLAPVRAMVTALDAVLEDMPQAEPTGGHAAP